jgi:hypothetical protein
MAYPRHPEQYPSSSEDVTLEALRRRVSEAVDCLRRDDIGTARYLLCVTLEWWDQDIELRASVVNFQREDDGA